MSIKLTMNTTEEAIKEHQELCNQTKQEMADKGFVGPWTTEPDRLEWKIHGLTCLVARNPFMLNWCGYVGIPKEHPYHGVEYDHNDGDNPVEKLDVHGGVTYSNHCSHFICHTTDEEEDDLFWIGFDCAHFDDIVPELDMLRAERKDPLYIDIESLEKQLGMDGDKNKTWGKTYKDFFYITQQTQYLAKQLAEVKIP